jgi:MoxR-like ATPase
MTKPATITHFRSNKGREFLFFNGAQVRKVINGLIEKPEFHGAPTNLPTSKIVNFAKIALVKSPGGEVTFCVKVSAAHQYEPLTIPSHRHASIPTRYVGAEIAAAIVPLAPGGEVDRAIIHVIGAAMRGVASAAQFDALAACAQPHGYDTTDTNTTNDKYKAGTHVPLPGHVATVPQPIANTASKDAAAPSTLDAFGTLGSAIRAEIDARIELAPKAPSVTVTVSVPGYVPVTLPAGETLHERFSALLLRCTAQMPKDRNVLLVGARGSGKTHAAEQVAKSLGLAFDGVSMSGGTTERAFWGSTTLQNGTMSWKPSRFVDMFGKGGVFLIDELDKADPTVVTALNMATSNGYIVPVDAAERIERHPDFIVIAGANALANDRAYTASVRLDASSLDRFAIMQWGYSDAITKHVAGQCGSELDAEWLVRTTGQIRRRIESKGWGGEVEWGTRSVARVASWIRAKVAPLDAVAMEMEALPNQVREELRMGLVY